MTTVRFNEESLYELRDESLRVYLWMLVYMPVHGYEISYREIAGMLQVSPTTVRKAMDILVEKGYITRTVNIGMTATYNILR